MITFVLVTLVYWVTTQYTLCLDHTNSALLAHVEPDAHHNNQFFSAGLLLSHFPACTSTRGYSVPAVELCLSPSELLEVCWRSP